MRRMLAVLAGFVVLALSTVGVAGAAGTRTVSTTTRMTFPMDETQPTRCAPYEIQAITGSSRR